MQIYGDTGSGNCLKVKYLADYLGLDYEWLDVDIMDGGSRTDAFLAMNPQGQVPLLRLDDARCLAQSNAILRYLAAGSALLPEDPFMAAKVDEWLFWEQYSHEPYVAVCRFQMVYLGKSRDEREAWRVTRAEQALDFMEQRLAATCTASTGWLTTAGMTVADIALFPYTRVAGEGGFDLAGRPAVRAWLDRVAAGLGL